MYTKISEESNTVKENFQCVCQNCGSVRNGTLRKMVKKTVGFYKSNTFPSCIEETQSVNENNLRRCISMGLERSGNKTGKQK